MTWLLFSILCAFFAFMGEKAYGRTVYFYKTGLILILSLFVGLGGMFGTDHDGYGLYYSSGNFEISFNIIDFFVSDYTNHFEVGFITFNYFCKLLHLGEVGFFVATAIFINSFYVNLIFKSPKPYLTVICFIVSSYFVQETNLIRQTMAISVFLYSLQFIQQKKPVHYLLSIAFATLFHSSAMFLSPLAACCYISISSINRDKIIKILACIWFFSLLVQLGVLHLPSMAFLSFGDFKYNNYLGDYKVEGFNYSINLMFNVVVLLAFILGDHEKFTPYIYTLIVGCVLQNISVEMRGIARFILYFVCIWPFCVTTVLSKDFIVERKREILKVLAPLVVGYYTYTLVFRFILTTPLFGSKFYELSQIFN